MTDVVKKPMAGVSLIEFNDTLTQAFHTAKEALTATETKFFSNKGEVTEQIEVINWKTRLEAVDRIIKLAQLANNLLEMDNTKPTATTINVNYRQPGTEVNEDD